MAVVSQVVTINTSTPVLLAEAVERPMQVLTAGGGVYLGGPDLDSSNGFLAPGAATPLTLLPGDALYALAESGEAGPFNVLILGSC